MNTTISSPAQTFRVSIRSGTFMYGHLDETENLAEVREQLTQMRRAYPGSALQTFHRTTDDTLGTWRDATDDELDRIALTNAALALARILQEDLPRITWTLDRYGSVELSGQATTREQVEVYANLLKLPVTEDSNAYPNLQAAGVYDGTEITVYCHIRTEQPAEVKV